MIPQTRLPEGDEWPDGLPFLEARQPDGNLWRDDPPFSRRDGWRPLRLVLDDDSLTEEDISTVLAFSDYEEVEVWHTDPNVLPHLELQEPSQDYLPIRKIGEPGVSFSSFGVHLTQHLADRARRLAEETGCDEEIVWRLLVLSAAVDQKQVDGFVTRRRLLLDSRSPGEGTVFTVEEPPFGFFSALAGGFPGTVSRRKGIGRADTGPKLRVAAAVSPSPAGTRPGMRYRCRRAASQRGADAVEAAPTDEPCSRGALVGWAQAFQLVADGDMEITEATRLSGLIGAGGKVSSVGCHSGIETPASMESC